MLANDKMKKNFYGKWALARKTHRAMVDHIANGGRVVIGSYAGNKSYKSAERFRAGNDAVYIARGKHWDCLGYDQIMLAD